MAEVVYLKKAAKKKTTEPESLIGEGMYSPELQRRISERLGIPIHKKKKSPVRFKVVEKKTDGKGSESAKRPLKKDVASYQGKPLMTDKDVVSSGLQVRPAIDKETGQAVKVAFDPETGEAIAKLQTSIEALRDWMPPGLARRDGEGQFIDDESVSDSMKPDEVVSLVDNVTGEAKEAVVKEAFDKKTGATVKLAIDAQTGRPVAVQRPKKKSPAPMLMTSAALWFLFL